MHFLFSIDNNAREPSFAYARQRTVNNASMFLKKYGHRAEIVPARNKGPDEKKKARDR